MLVLLNFMGKNFFLTCIFLFVIVSSQLDAQKNDKISKKISEITSLVNIDKKQKASIINALIKREEKLNAFDGIVVSKENAYKKYEIDKECHEKLIGQLSDQQISDYCKIVFAPEVSAKTNYHISLLKEVDNDYTESELTAAWNAIYKYLMLEKIVYFKYKYDYAKQKENISRLKAIQPKYLKSSINNEKQKGYGKVISGKVNWQKGK